MGQFKVTTIYVIEVPKGKMCVSVGGEIIEIIDGNFPNLKKITNPQIKEAQSTPSTRNIKKITLRHIIIKLLKTSDKEKILKIARRKKSQYM